MVRLRTTLFLGLGFLLVHVRGQDFDLADALDHPEETITKKPPLTPKRPVFDDHPKPHPRPPYQPQPGSYDNNGDNHPKPQPYPPFHPQPGRHSNSDSFNDLDLNDGKPLPPRPAGEKESNLNHGGNTDSGVVAGVTSPVISVLVLLVVGTVAGYTAYKKKTLCFKANVAQPIYYVLPGMEDTVSALKSMGQLCKLAREELPSDNDMINQRYVSHLLVF